MRIDHVIQSFAPNTIHQQCGLEMCTIILKLKLKLLKVKVLSYWNSPINCHTETERIEAESRGWLLRVWQICAVSTCSYWRGGYREWWMDQQMGTKLPIFAHHFELGSMVFSKVAEPSLVSLTSEFVCSLHR